MPLPHTAQNGAGVLVVPCPEAAFLTTIHCRISNFLGDSYPEPGRWPAQRAVPCRAFSWCLGPESNRYDAMHRGVFSPRTASREPRQSRVSDAEIQDWCGSPFFYRSPLVLLWSESQNSFATFLLHSMSRITGRALKLIVFLGQSCLEDNRKCWK